MRKPLPYKPKPKPKTSKVICVTCNKVLKDFELLYGCSTCSRLKKV